MPAWLAPLIIGAISTAGEALTGRANQKEAQRNRDFQERMSSTAVQRSVADYKAAGLNPGLAYERSASSPSGSTAQIGNAIEKGVNSAQSFASNKQAMQIAREQNNAQMVLMREQAGAAKAGNAKATAEAELAYSQRNSNDQAARFAAALQPGIQRMQEAQNMLALYQIPGARNTAKLEEAMGLWSPGLRVGASTAKTIADVLGSLKPRAIGKGLGINITNQLPKIPGKIR